VIYQVTGDAILDEKDHVVSFQEPVVIFLVRLVYIVE